MYCDNCGNKIDEGVDFCDNCGTKTGKAMPPKEDKSNLLRIIKIALVLSMVCFLMPFVTVSCDGREVTANGLELATGIFSDSILKEAKADGGILPNVFVLFSLMATLIATIICFKNNDAKFGYITGFCITSVICIVIFILSFTSYYKFSEEDKLYLDVEFNIGVWATIVLNTVAAILTQKGRTANDRSLTLQSENELPEVKSSYAGYMPGKQRDVPAEGFEGNGQWMLLLFIGVVLFVCMIGAAWQYATSEKKIDENYTNNPRIGTFVGAEKEREEYEKSLKQGQDFNK